MCASAMCHVLVVLGIPCIACCCFAPLTGRRCVCRQAAKWTSPFAAFDALMALETLAIAHLNKASDLVHADYSVDGMTQGNKHLRIASGVFSYAAETVLPLFMAHAKPGVATPAETLRPLLEGLAASMLAQACGRVADARAAALAAVLTHTLVTDCECVQAQQCAIGKAESEGKSVELLAKLEMGVKVKYAEAMRHFTALVRVVYCCRACRVAPLSPA